VATKAQHVNPELRRQLAAAQASSPVEATFTLRTPTGMAYRDEESTSETAERIVHAAAAATESTEYRLKVFARIQSFLLVGPPALIRAVMAHEEVATATANRQAEDLLIRPVPAKKATRPKRAMKKAAPKKTTAKRATKKSR